MTNNQTNETIDIFNDFQKNSKHMKTNGMYFQFKVSSQPELSYSPLKISLMQKFDDTQNILGEFNFVPILEEPTLKSDEYWFLYKPLAHKNGVTSFPCRGKINQLSAVLQLMVLNPQLRSFTSVRQALHF